jgi:hypothetical protein
VGGGCVSHRLALFRWLKTHLQQEIRLLLDCCGIVYIDTESRRQDWPVCPTVRLSDLQTCV